MPSRKTPEFATLRDLFIEQLKDLYSAETQIIKKGLPAMIKKASDRQLKAGLTAHLKETKGQLKRLNQISKRLQKKLTGETCQATAGLIKEAAGWMKEDATDAVMDAGIIADGQRIEHYEIAAYGTAIEFAKLLGERECARLLGETLAEEKSANDSLTAGAKTVNQDALGEE